MVRVDYILCLYKYDPKLLTFDKSTLLFLTTITTRICKNRNLLNMSVGFTDPTCNLLFF
jgi:hypothetical protein